MNRRTKKRLIVFCGGPSSEHDVSIASAKNILATLNHSKYRISLLYIGRDLSTRYFPNISRLQFLSGKPPRKKLPATTTPKDMSLALSGAKIVDFSKESTHPLFLALSKTLTSVDLTFLGAMHGEFVEDGHLQAMLDALNIPYTGSGMAASALAMDKYRSMLLVQNIQRVSIPNTSIWKGLTSSDEVRPLKAIKSPFGYPLIVKPNDLGSSVGVAIVKNEQELRKHVKFLSTKYPNRTILFQEYIRGATEVSCGCLEDRKGNFTPLPPVEIIPKKSTIFSYESKYETNGAEEMTPPKTINGSIGAEISLLACEIHALLGCRIYSRSDFLVKGEAIYYLETNTLPGMTANSLLPKEAAAVGISFSKLLDFIIENSLS